jgi:hypothetical protein
MKFGSWVRLFNTGNCHGWAHNKLSNCSTHDAGGSILGSVDSFSETSQNLNLRVIRPSVLYMYRRIELGVF